jgi:CubicO group peptidase (beta-lactamase class C family)
MTDWWNMPTRQLTKHVRKIGNARVAICTAIFSLVWHLISAAQPVLAEDLVKTPPGKALSREKLKKLDTFFNNEVSAGKIPGAIVLIEQHDQPIYFGIFGLRDNDTGAPMPPDTIFPIHSMTKTITSFATMMLIDQGRLKLDDPLAKYIPAFAGVRVGAETKDENGTPMLTLVSPRRPINIEDLLLHTSGITYESNGHSLVKKLYTGITVGDFDNAEFVERIAKLPLAEQPRTLWEYGHSTDILGRVIEVVSGQSLYEFEKQQLLDPLGMLSTKFFLTDLAERSRLAKALPTERYNTRSSLDVTRWESGGAGMVSTIGDFSRFARMLLHGGTLDGHRFLKPETFKAMTTDHIGPGSGVARNFYYYPGDGFGFGYGFGVRTDPGNAIPPPPGAIGEIKWDGASGTYFVVDPEHDMFFVLLEDAPVQRGNVQRILKQMIYNSFEDSPSPAASMPGPR